MKANSTSSSSLSTPSSSPVDLKTSLSHEYTLWVQDLSKKEIKTDYNFEEQIKPTVTIKNVKEFCALFTSLRKPKDIHSGADTYFFKKGIKPMWEDPANKGGGKFFLHIKKSFATKLWENLLFSLVSEEIPEMKMVNGIILKIHRLEVVFYIWTREIPVPTQEILKNWVKSTVGLSPKIKLEFKKHPVKKKYK